VCHNTRTRRQVAACPSPFPPGSPQKIALLALRARLRLPLFVPGDVPLGDDQGFQPRNARNGTMLGRALVERHQDGSVEVLEEPPAASEPPRPRRPAEVRSRGTASYRAAEAERKRRERVRRKTEKRRLAGEREQPQGRLAAVS